MTCHHIPSVRCPECADDRPSMGYWPTPCGTCAALREENARLRADMGKWQEIADKRGAEVARLEGLILAYDHAYREELPHIASAREDDLLAEARRIRGKER